MNDWIETSQEEIDEFNRYYRYVEHLIAEKEGLLEGKFGEVFEYSFVKRKGLANMVTYYRTDLKGKKKKNSLRSIDVLPFDKWKIVEKRDKLLQELGI